MAPAVAPTSLTLEKARQIDTVIFVDVDGVLNIGAQDADGPPLLLNKTNMTLAMQDWGDRDMSEHEVALEKLRALAGKELGHGDNCTYSEFVCSSTWSISDELAKRLAGIVRMAGDRDRVAVVLASNWRRSQHASKVRKLEEHVGLHLGQAFAFDAMTAKGMESTASDRLAVISKFLAQLNGQRAGLYAPLQALVLDDFFIADMHGWFCEGYEINSVEDAELYLQLCSCASAPVKAKVVLCVDTWITPSGLEMRVGGGLTMRRVSEAVAFLLSGQQSDSELESEEDLQKTPREVGLGDRPLGLLVKAPSAPNFVSLLKSNPMLSESRGAVDALAREHYAPWIGIHSAS